MDRIKEQGGAARASVVIVVRINGMADFMLENRDGCSVALEDNNATNLIGASASWNSHHIRDRLALMDWQATEIVNQLLDTAAVKLASDTREIQHLY